ncbi:MAG: hypothetical protein EHM58_16800 [Ignavibacteriae bacterium]|nr:MAG: hypothetical protein EHM58_16800 [Ignavibacteriota bacterium]
MKEKYKCYISAPSDYDLTKIEMILDKLDIEYHNFYDFSIGITFSDLILRKIRESDFIVSILTKENTNVLFELGVAEGLEKPAFILVDKEFKVPFFLERKIYFQTNFKDTKLFELALLNFIYDLKLKKPKQLKQKQKDKYFTIAETNELVSAISQLRKEPHEHEIFHLITNAFSKLKIQNTSISDVSRDKGADIIIRSKELTPYFGNPILIEIKAGTLNIQRLNDAQLRLQQYILKTEAKGGIILYLDKNNRRFTIPLKNPLILCFDIEDFFLGIAAEGLEKFLIKKRNEIAHGSWN